MLTAADVQFFCWDDRTYCLDVNASSLFEVDAPGACAIESIIQTEGDGALLDSSAAEDANARAVLDRLRSNGFFAGNTKRYRLACHPKRQVNLLGLSLFVSGRCTLSCRYCFNDGGEAANGERLMSRKVAERAVDFLLEHSTGHVGLDFFGGEPLLSAELIAHVVGYSQQANRPFQYALITNGTVLNRKIIRLLAEHHFHVVISYDGYQQDLMRPPRGGKALSGRVRQTIATLRDVLPPRDISIRCIFTHAMDDLQRIIAEARELGVRLLFGPVTLPSGDELDLSRADLDRLAVAQETAVLAALRERDVAGMTAVSSVVNTVLRAMHARQRYYSCGIGKDILGVATNGDLYPCHRFIGMPQFKMGNVFQDINSAAFASWSDLYVDNRAGCSQCWARYFCGGGCAHEAWMYEGNTAAVVPSRCEFSRKEIELGLRVFASMLDSCPELLPCLEQRLSGTNASLALAIPKRSADDDDEKEPH